jgi:hypothetical protein
MNESIFIVWNLNLNLDFYFTLLAIQFHLEMRHEFVPFPQPLPNGASAFCKYCGAENIENRPGCVSISTEQSKLLKYTSNLSFI